MTLEMLQNAMISALKAGDKTKRQVLSGLIDAVKKASMTNKGRVEITEQLVDETLLKQKKVMQEMIDTCPADRVETLAEYVRQMDVVLEYAPSIIDDPDVIKLEIMDAINGEIEFTKANRGKIMKIIAPMFKGKADMSVVNKVVGELLQ